MWWLAFLKDLPPYFYLVPEASARFEIKDSDNTITTPTDALGPLRHISQFTQSKSWY